MSDFFLSECVFYSILFCAVRCLQSTALNLNKKYAKKWFELHDDSNFQLFELTFLLNSVSRGSVRMQPSVHLPRVYINLRDVDCNLVLDLGLQKN